MLVAASLFFFFFRFPDCNKGGATFFPVMHEGGALRVFRRSSGDGCLAMAMALWEKVGILFSAAVHFFSPGNVQINDSRTISDALFRRY